MSISNLSRWSRFAEAQQVFFHCYSIDMAEDEQRPATPSLSHLQPSWLQHWIDFKILLLTFKALPRHSAALHSSSETLLFFTIRTLKMMPPSRQV